MAAPTAPHHERQSRMQCALHATNAILQSAPFFTASDFDALARSLDAAEASLGAPAPGLFSFSAHRIPVLGVWSVEVIKAGLAMRSLEACHFPSEAAGVADDHGVAGFLVNRLASGLSGFLGGRHWVALVPVGGAWHNFDSNFPAPRMVGTLANVLQLLTAEPKTTTVLLVKRQAL